MSENICSIVGCDAPIEVKSRGLCNAHNHRWKRYGDPLYLPYGTDQERFWEKVDRRGPDECWPWLGSLTADGYGQFWYEGKNRRAHKVMWEWDRGPVPEGLDLDHICHQPMACHGGVECLHRRCENMVHLRLATNAENCSAERSVRRRAPDIPGLATEYEAGVTLPELARRHGVGMTTIYKRLLAAGVTMRQRGPSRVWR